MWMNAPVSAAEATKLASMFAENFAAFESGVTSAVKAAGPSV